MSTATEDLDDNDPPSPDGWSGGTHVAGDLPPAILEAVAEDWECAKPVAGVWLAVAITFVIQLFTIDLPNRAVAGPWMGFALRPEGSLPGILPPVWRFLSQVLAAYLPLTPANASMAVSMGGVALGAMAVAALAAHWVTLGKRDNRWIAVLGAGLVGAAAGFSTGRCDAALLARYSAGPEGLSAALALSGLFFFLRTYDRPGLPLGLVLGELLLGLASIDQPCCLVLFIFSFFYLFLLGNEDPRQRERLVATLLAYAFPLGITALALLRSGVAPQALVEHILALPFPRFGVHPDAFKAFTGRPSTNFSLLTLAAIVWALISGRGILRREYVFAAVAAALLVPGMIYIANPPRDLPVPIDLDAPRLAGTGILIAAGVAAAGRLFTKTQNPKSRALYNVMAVVAIMLVEWTSRTNGLIAELDSSSQPGVLAQTMIRDTPQGALVVVGTINTAGTLWAMQAADAYRPDLRILPAPWLTRTDGRIAARTIVGDHIELKSEFPDDAAIERWGRELPMYVGDLKKASSEEFRDRLLPFALWDVVTQEAPHASVYFLGVDAPWLLDRGTQDSVRLRYPAGDSLEVNTEYRPLWSGPENPNQWRSDTAIIDAVNDRVFALRNRTAETDPEAAAALTRLQAQIESGSGKLTEETKKDTDLLWRHNQLFLLRTVYRGLSERSGCEAENFYQLAAVYAQLGEWTKTEEALNQWLRFGKTQKQAEEDGVSGAAMDRLMKDTRFELFQAHGGIPRQLSPDPAP